MGAPVRTTRRLGCLFDAPSYHSVMHLLIGLIVGPEWVFFPQESPETALPNQEIIYELFQKPV